MFIGEKLEAVENICQHIKTETDITVKMMRTVQENKNLNASYSNDKRERAQINKDETSEQVDFQHYEENDFGGNHFWLVGTSIVKDMKPKLIYRFKRSRISTLRDKTIFGAKTLIQTGCVKAKTIAFQVGSNDLDEPEKSPEMIGEEIKGLIETTRNIIPDCNVIINELLPRYHKNLMARKEYEEKRIKCNQIISDICDTHEAHLVQH